MCYTTNSHLNHCTAPDWCVPQSGGFILQTTTNSHLNHCTAPDWCVTLSILRRILHTCSHASCRALSIGPPLCYLPVTQCSLDLCFSHCTKCTNKNVKLPTAFVFLIWFHHRKQSRNRAITIGTITLSAKNDFFCFLFSCVECQKRFFFVFSFFF